MIESTIYYMCLVCDKIFTKAAFDSTKYEDVCPDCGSTNYIRVQEVENEERAEDKRVV